MKTKTCTKCKQIKVLDEFALNKRKNDGHQDWCRLSKNRHHQLYYQGKKPEWVQNDRERRLKLRAWIDMLRQEPCVDCQNVFDPVCMDFDHLNNKLFNVSTMVVNGFSKQRIIEEIAKCELVCANCHRIRTKARLSSG